MVCYIHDDIAVVVFLINDWLIVQTVKKNLLAKQKVGITQKHLGALISDLST